MATDFNISFTQGDNYEVSIPLWTDAEQTVPFDFAGYNAAMQVRRNPRAPVLLELSTANGGLAFVTEEVEGKSTNSIRITINPDDSARLPAGKELGFDLQLSNGADYVRTLLRGTLNTEPEYTR